jgi:hypothetical protein
VQSLAQYLGNSILREKGQEGFPGCGTMHRKLFAYSRSNLDTLRAFYDLQVNDVPVIQHRKVHRFAALHG